MDFSFLIWHVDSLSSPSSRKKNAEQTDNQQLILHLQIVKVIKQTAAPNPRAIDGLSREFQEQIPEAGARNGRNTSNQIAKLPEAQHRQVSE